MNPPHPLPPIATPQAAKKMMGVQGWQAQARARSAVESSEEDMITITMTMIHRAATALAIGSRKANRGAGMHTRRCQSQGKALEKQTVEVLLPSLHSNQYIALQTRSIECISEIGNRDQGLKDGVHSTKDSKNVLDRYTVNLDAV